MEKTDGKGSLQQPGAGLIGKLWRGKLEQQGEYLITPAPAPDDQRLPGAGYLFDQEYHSAQRLKQKLLRQYRGSSIDEITRGRAAITAKGSCLALQDQVAVVLNSRQESKAVLDLMLEDLKLVFGIREETERALKSAGYRTIEDLAAHPRFGDRAREVMNLLHQGALPDLFNLVVFRHTRSHPHLLGLSGMHRIERFLFLDIETMGLFQRPIILIGVAVVEDGSIQVTQYLARDIREEPAAICATLSHLEGLAGVVTYNGRHFDLPYLEERAAYYRLVADLGLPNFDLLYFTRRYYREQLPDCRLCTLEQHLLGQERFDDVPSALVPEFYETYLRTGNPGPLVPILEHNKQDLVSLVNLFIRLSAELSPCP